MKRVKVMLLAIAVIALAAGTLAFKAHYGFQFCTISAITTVENGPYTCTTTLPNGNPTALACTNLTVQKLTEPEVATITVCTTAPTTIDGEVTCQGRRCTAATTKLSVE